MDQSVDLFGQKMFSPIIVGPIAQQQQFHPEGELATARGASAAKSTDGGEQRFQRPPR